MSVTKRSENDRTVVRYQAPDGLHIAWEDSATGETYGAILQGDAALAALRADGVDPDQFWPEIGSA